MVGGAPVVRTEPAAGSSSPPPLRRRLPRPLRILGALLLLALVAWLLRAPILRGAGGWLDVGEAPARADVILLHVGDLHARPARAAALWRAGWAPRIVVAREAPVAAINQGLAAPDRTEAIRRLLRAEGVPDSAVVVLAGPPAASTADEAAALRRYVERTGARRVLAVTTAYHTRRARWLLRRALRGTGTEVRMVSAADPRFDADDWWRSEDGLVTYVTEYLRWLHNLAVR